MTADLIAVADLGVTEDSIVEADSEVEACSGVVEDSIATAHSEVAAEPELCRHIQTDLPWTSFWLSLVVFVGSSGIPQRNQAGFHQWLRLMV